MKKTLPMALSISLLLAAAVGCSGGGSAPAASGTPATPSSGPAASPSAEPKPVKLRFAWWGGQSRHDYTLKMIEMYQKANPHVTIEPEYAAFDDYWKKLTPQAAANDLPDVIQMSVAYISQYADRGQIVDLGPYMESGLFDKSSFEESYLKVGQYNGKQYQMTLGVNALAVVTDPQMIKDAGGTPPTNTWTWDDLEQIGAQLKSKGKLLTGEIDDRNFLNFYLRGFDQNLYSHDGKGLGFTDEKLYTDYYTRYLRMYENGYLLSRDKQALKKGTPEDEELVMGNAGVSFTWSNLFVAYSKAAKRTLDIVPPPGPNIDKGLFLQSSQGLSVSKHSKNIEEAVKFASWLVNDVEANKVMKGERGVPPSSKVREAIKPLLTPEEQKVVDYVAWAGTQAKSNNPIDPIGAVESTKLLEDLSEQILYKRITPADSAAKFLKEGNAIIAKNK